MKVYILIGNIASGKSTYVKKEFSSDECYIISKDDYRKALGNLFGIGYLWYLDIEPNINKAIKEAFLISLKLKLPKIIIDETNMTKQTRAFYLQQALKYNYNTIGIVFPTKEKETHIKRRLQNNHGNISKEIWERVFDEKQSRYEKPTLNEGFDKIIQL